MEIYENYFHFLDGTNKEIYDTKLMRNLQTITSKILFSKMNLMGLLISKYCCLCHQNKNKKE